MGDISSFLKDLMEISALLKRHTGWGIGYLVHVVYG